MASISPTSRPGYVYDSATDTWIPIGIGPHTHQATDLSGVVDDALIDAKGDLIVGLAADTPARLAVGNNGETLVADSSATTGLRWQGNFAAGKNAIINGGMDIWQRGTSFTYTSPTIIFTADRFNITNAGGSGTPNATVSRQASGLTGIEYCLRFARNSGNTATTSLYISQDVETSNSIPFAGKTVTISFYARAGANYSPTSSAYTFNLFSGTGTNQSLNNTGYTGQATVVSVGATLTTSWQRFTGTGTVSSLATQLGIQAFFTPTGTAGANDYMEITGVQLEVGSVATQFSRAGGTIAGELAACQRYFQRATSGNGFPLTIGQAYSSTNTFGVIRYPVTMRTAPTITISSAGNFQVFNGSLSAITATAFAQNEVDSNGSAFNFTVASGLTAGNASYIKVSNASGTFDLSSEL